MNNPDNSFERRYILENIMESSLTGKLFAKVLPVSLRSNFGWSVVVDENHVSNMKTRAAF